ncbi:MAG: hypothetical protein DCC55_21970 [Chloroflexi bacterium]|nr:MAG: hypothetical protein DCC55_21970 [Chloroflexota bacterium]
MLQKVPSFRRILHAVLLLLLALSLLQPVQTASAQVDTGGGYEPPPVGNRIRPAHGAAETLTPQIYLPWVSW